MKQVDFIQTSDSGILTKEDHDPIILNKTGVEIYQYYVDNKQITAAHKPWPRYPDKCPTCGNGKVEDWEVFKYYGLFK